MGITLPNSGNVFTPEIPRSIQDQDMINYLRRLSSVIEKVAREQFNNSLAISTVINSGVSGTFTISSGGSIVVTSGIVISVTS